MRPYTAPDTSISRSTLRASTEPTRRALPLIAPCIRTSAVSGRASTSTPSKRSNSISRSESVSFAITVSPSRSGRRPSKDSAEKVNRASPSKGAAIPSRPSPDTVTPPRLASRLSTVRMPADAVRCAITVSTWSPPTRERDHASVAAASIESICNPRPSIDRAPVHSDCLGSSVTKFDKGTLSPTISKR